MASNMEGHVRDTSSRPELEGTLGDQKLRPGEDSLCMSSFYHCSCFRDEKSESQKEGDVVPGLVGNR